MNRFVETRAETPRRAMLVVATGLAGVAGLGLAVLGLRRLLRAYRQSHPEPKLVKVAEVSRLFIYPVKSCKGIPLTEVEVNELGLQKGPLKDRQWLIVDEKWHMITGRVEPTLVLVSVSSENGFLCLNAPDMEELRVPLKLPKSNPVKMCRVWGCNIEGRDCGDEAADWISTYLKNSKAFRLVCYEPSMRPRYPNEKAPLFSDKDKTVYNDTSSCMMMSEATVEDFNTKLEKKVKMENFRPVVVVKDCKPYAEDTWKGLQIGTTKLYHRMYCTRCVFTTVDPDTGIIDRKEPLETLKRYRQCDPSERHIYKSVPVIGSHYGIEKSGVIRVGDPVYLIVDQ
ncbi:mitochondrial amidoxime-reducing component 1 [Stegostoma tigrinum]|uniref:mitochondrial amidoxime-reducing component 1 n=1 Tax=Stegostoma tigrinum TaxID=3053191 RepID=UPI00202B0AFD|nr:mitochondrial amidoxime-reducing component 1 [Stegostoma tigrinum]